MKKGRYVYYHCTGSHGPCGNTYIREEGLGLLLGEIVRRVQISPEIADWIADALRDSQVEKGQFHREAVSRLGRRRDTVQRKLDRGYEDLLSGKITDELWTRKSQEWESDLAATRDELARHDRASSN